jgi:putative transposase
MRKTYKYRIYPSKAQATALERQLEASRLVYNRTLAVRKSSYENQGLSVGLYDTQKLLTVWKSEHPPLRMVHSQVLQNVQVRVDLAFQAFFRRVKEARLARARGEEPDEVGYPRFKGIGRYDSLCYPQYGNGARLDGNVLILSKVGSVKGKLHRELIGTPKTVCVRRGAGGKWYTTISCECESSPLPDEPKAVGVDVGLLHFATLSNGETIANPRFFKREQKALATTQRRMEKFAKGTPERAKRRLIVSRIHTRIANKRSNFAHQVSCQLVNTYGVIVFEKLAVIDMMANHTQVFGNKLNKNIADVAWSQLAQFTAYKAADAGRLFLQVDPRNTSKMCSCCRALVPKDLGVRIHDCPHCGLKLDRDHNAAINILALGLQGVSAGSPDEAVEAPVFRHGE